MNIRKAERKRSYIRIALQGPAGSGKTYSALLLAKGLTGSLSNVCIIDSEAGSADLYAHLGDYNVINLQAPYTPEKYIEAIITASKAQMECIIIDSLSHAWEHLLGVHGQMTGNSFTNWSKITPRHRSLIQCILSSSTHIISTLRTKQDYVLSDKGDGKLRPEKVGLKSIQRDGVDYEFTILYELDINHNAVASKDRTGLFRIDAPMRITESTGRQIKEWCDDGVSIDHVHQLIAQADSVQELTEIYKQYTAYYPQVKEAFTNRKHELLLTQTLTTKAIQNGQA